MRVGTRPADSRPHQIVEDLLAQCIGQRIPQNIHLQGAVDVHDARLFTIDLHWASECFVLQHIEHRAQGAGADPAGSVNVDQMGGDLPVFPVPALLHDDLATHNAVALLGDGGTEMTQQADEGYYPNASPIVLFLLAHRASLHARIHGDKRLDRSSGISSFGIFALYHESGQGFEYVA